jgi:hypothetical protein
MEELITKEFCHNNYSKFLLTKTLRSNSYENKSAYKLSLKKINSNSSLAVPLKHKTYYRKGTIMRTGLNYVISTPKAGNGKFQIFDNNITIIGELKKGRIVGLEQLTQRISDIDYLRILNSKSVETACNNVEKILNKTKEGSLNLHNVTKIMLKKVLKYLSK